VNAPTRPASSFVCTIVEKALTNTAPCKTLSFEVKNIAFILTGLLVCSSPFKSIAEPLKNDQKLKPFSASEEAVRYKITDKQSQGTIPKKPKIPFITAVHIGDFFNVYQHLQAGANVNGSPRDPGARLYVSLQEGFSEITKLLIANGADVNVKYSEGWTALHKWSVKGGNKEIGEILISEGANLNPRTDYGRTPLDVAKDDITAQFLKKQGCKSGAEYSLVVAVDLGDIQAVKKHLSSNANLNERDNLGYTPLHHAAGKAKEFAKLLIDHGAQMNPVITPAKHEHEEGLTPLDVAVAEKNTKTAAFLREHGGRYSTIFRAIMAGDAEAVQVFISSGVEVSVKSKYQFSPLHYAAIYGQKKIAEYLINEGASVNARTVDSHTPLFFALRDSHHETADLIREQGGVSGARDSLLTAAIVGDLPAVKLHLEAKENVNTQDERGLTPLHYAVKLKTKAIAELLIQNGANINAKNKQEWTPLHWSIYEGCNTEIVKLLIANGADVNAEDRTMRTPLIASAKTTHGKIIAALIEAGANINATDWRKGTPLHYAAERGFNEITGFLLANGADVTFKDEDGNTPLDIANKPRTTDIQ
jgi:ankyrin repeat protein